MGFLEIILIFLILLLGIFCMAGANTTPPVQRPNSDDKNLARLRQMKEWDRFTDDNEKE